MAIKYTLGHPPKALKTGGLGKKITFIGLNFYPEDTAIGLYSSQWVQHLEDHDFEVSVITAFPYYPQWEIREAYKNKPKFFKEEKGKTKIFRYKQYVPKKPTFLRRILHIIDFTIGAFFNLYKIKKSDLVIAVVPFTSAVFLGYIQKKRFKAPLWIHVQDFEFDAALQSGFSNKLSGVFSMLLKLEKWLFSKADIASTISLNMLSKLEAKTKTQTFFLPNWIDGESINPDKATQHKYVSSKKKKLLYSGSIGDKQDWQAFLQFCADLNEKKYEVIVVGDGSKRAWLEKQINKINLISLYPPVKSDELSNLLCGADLHLLFQKTDILDTVMPSKILGMMASGKPSLVIGNKDSEVKQIFEISNGGLFFSNYSNALANAVEKLMECPSSCEKMGKAARAYVLSNFSKAEILNKMTERVKTLLQHN